jgi:hypothetical protein
LLRQRLSDANAICYDLQHPISMVDWGYRFNAVADEVPASGVQGRLPRGIN